MALLSTQPLTWSATLLTTLLLPHFLGDAGFGEYSIALNMAGIMAVVFALGVPNYLLRRIAVAPEHADEEGSAALLLVLTATLAGGLILIVLQPLLGVTSGLGRFLIVAGVVWSGLSAALRIAASVLNGRQRHARFAWLNACVVVAAALIGSAALVLGGNATIYMAVTACTSALVLGVGWRLAGLHFDRRGLNLRLWWLCVGGGASFFFVEVAIQIRNGIDVILLGSLASHEAAGWLAAAYRIAFLPLFLPTIITVPLFASLSKVAGEDDVSFARLVRRSLVGLLILTVPAAALTLALAPSIPDLLRWGPTFAPSAPVMMILSLDQPLGAVDTLFATAMFALKRERRWLIVGLVGAMMNPLLNLLAIPAAEQYFHNGALGAATVEVFTELAMMACALYLLPRGLLDRATVGACARIVLAGAGVALVIGLLRPVNPILAACAGGLAYVVGVAVLRVVRREDVQLAIAAVRDALERRRTTTASRL